MKKITIMAFMLMSGFYLQAQTSFEASKDYGKLMNVTYDANIPNKLYAATQGNHIVVSTDNGQNWSVLYSHPESFFLDDLRLTPDHNSLSFSTRTTLYVYSLATNTITASVPVPQNNVEGAGASYYSSYSMFDSAGTVMVVDTGFPFGFSSQGKTFYTQDGGANWSEIYYTVDHDNVFVNNVAISPTDNKKILLARGNGDSDIDGGMWISLNSGGSWTQTLNGVTLDPISFNPGNSDDILVGSSIGFGSHAENIFRSADGGVTWQTQDIVWTDETLNNITSIKFNPANPQEIIALEENEIVRTTDNGATWSNVIYPVGTAMDYYYGIDASFNPFDSNQIAVTTDFYPQHFNKTTNALSQIKAPFYNIISTSVGKYASGTELYYGAQGGRFHKNIASGVTDFYDTEDPNSFNPKKNYIIADPVVAGRVFTYASMGFFGGALNMSTDYGATKTNILQAFSDDIQELTVDPNNNNIIYVSMRSGESGIMTKIDFTDLENIVTTDIVTPEVSEFGEGVVTGIVVAGTDSNTIYITKKTGFYKSVDGGTTWTLSNDGLEDIDAATDLIWDMARNPLNPDQYTLCSNRGVFNSVDSGAHWTSILPGVDVRRVKHSPLNPNVIVASVFANANETASIQYTTDGGENWTAIAAPELMYVNSYGMDYDFDGDTIDAYIGTSDLGVVKYEIHDDALGVKNATASSAIGLYPNPAMADVNVMTNDTVETVSIYSLSGQKVMENRSKSFNVSGLSNGIYVVKVKTVNGRNYVQKLVKK